MYEKYNETFVIENQKKKKKKKIKKPELRI